MPMKTKKISADEARNIRKDFVRDTDRGAAVCKAAKAPASWDKELRSARFLMTATSPDRYRDVVVTEGLDTTEFERNPVGLLFHNSRSWPVANWGNLEKVLKGRPPRMEGDFILLPAGGPIPEIEQTEWMLANGGIRACSIGFIPDWNEIEMILDEEERWQGGLLFRKSELCEASVVPVPALPSALLRDAGKMSLARELIEDILDNWAKTPEGLLVPRAEYEATHKAATGERTTVVIKTPDDAEEIPADWETISDEVDRRAAVVVDKGASDPAEEKSAEEPKTATDEEIDAFLATAQKGDVIAVERQGLKAETYGNFVHEKANEESACIVIERADKERFTLATPRITPEQEGRMRARRNELSTDKDHSGTSVKLNLDTTEAEKDIGRVSGLLEGLSEKIAGIFKRHAPQERVEPAFEPPAPPSVEAVVAAKSRAASVRERVAAKAA